MKGAGILLNELEIERLLTDNILFHGESIVVAKNENSELVRKVKPCNKEFFDKIFNRHLWDLYAELSLASRPYDSRYLVFLNNEMFFVVNTGQRFLSSIGLEHKYMLVDGKIFEYTPRNLTNLTFMLAEPLELFRNAFNVSLSALKINSMLKSFEKHYDDSYSYWMKYHADDLEDLPLIVSSALDGAFKSMRYSLLATIAQSIGIRFGRMFPVEENLVESIISDVKTLSLKDFIVKHGYYSLSPYDISKPSLDEDVSIINLVKDIPSSSEPFFILRENAKICCSMYLDIIRKCFQSFGERYSIGADVFYLYPSELSSHPDVNVIRKHCSQRRTEFEKSLSISLPPKIIFIDGKPFFEDYRIESIQGVSAGAPSSIVGDIVFIDSTEDLKNIESGDIIASRHLSPDLVVYYNKCGGIISEVGGKLAHAAIVAREMNLPCIIQVEGFNNLREGLRVKVDGRTGKITVIKE